VEALVQAAITREKENGTLRTILSNLIGRAALATGKLVGGYVTLAIPLLMSFLVGVLVLALTGLDVFHNDFMLRAGWILASSLLFIAVFFMLGLLVSSIVSSTYSALVLSLAFWLAAVMVLPRAGSLAGQLWEPVKSRQVTWLEKVSALNNIELEKGRTLQQAFERSSIIDKQGQRVAGENWQKERNKIAAPYDDRLEQTVRQIEDNFRYQKNGQRRLALALARLSPAGAFASFVVEMSGTGLQAEGRFLAEADRYRGTLQNELFSKFFRDVYPNGSVSMGMHGMINAAQLPEFRLPKPAVGASVQGSDLAIMLAWIMALACLIYGALSRYDVR
jgi:ABC-2 type transport system permease protein